MARILAAKQLGDDLNDGITAPVRDLVRAMWQAQTGDTVVCSGTSHADPWRSGSTAASTAAFLLPGGVTLRPAVKGERVHVSPCMDVSEGAVYEYVDLRQGFHLVDVGGWAAGSSTYITTDNPWGGHPTFGCRSLAAGQSMNRSFFLHQTRQVKPRIAYKASGGQRLRANLRQYVSGIAGVADGTYSYNFQTGQWGTPGAQDIYDENGALLDENNPAVNANGWADVYTGYIRAPQSADDITPDAVPSGTATNTIILQTSGSTVLLGWFRIYALAAWEHIGDNVWRLPGFVNGGRFTAYAGRVNPYSDSAMSGLFYCPAGLEDDYTSYRVSEGGTAAELTPPTEDFRSFFSATAGEQRLEFKVPAGQTITDYRLFAAAAAVGVRSEGASAGGKAVGLDVIVAQDAIVTQDSAASEWYDCGNHVSTVRAFMQTGTSAPKVRRWFNLQPTPSTYNKQYGEGYVVGQAGDATKTTSDIQGGFSHWAGDEAYQPIGAGQMVARGIIAIEPQQCGIEINTTAGTGHVHEIHGYTCVGAGLNGFRHQADGAGVAITVNMSNVLCLDSGSLDFEAAASAHTDSIYNFGENVYGGTVGGAGYLASATISAAWDAGISIGHTAASLGVDPATGELSADSALIGTAHYTGNPGPSGNGEPYPNYGADPGGAQSLHGNQHPARRVG